MNSKISIKKLIKKPLIMFINDPIKAIIRYFKMSLRKKSKLILCNENISFYFTLGSNAFASDLIFTTNQGVYIFNERLREVKKILHGKFYGITRYKGYFILTRNNHLNLDKSQRDSEIIAIKIDENKIIDYKTLLHKIPGEIHQIDVINDNLYIPHTNYNHLLIISMDKLFNSDDNQIPKDILSCNFLTLDIKKPSHLNSLYYYEEKNKAYLYLIAHNSTAHTGKNSDIIKLYTSHSNPKVKDWKIESIINTLAHSAHNIYCENGKLFYCDSNNGCLIYGNQVLFNNDCLLRGLSIIENGYFIGGSDIDFTGAKRSESNCRIFYVNKEGKHLGTLELPNQGNIYEIRQLSCDDYSISMYK